MWSQYGGDIHICLEDREGTAFCHCERSSGAVKKSGRGYGAACAGEATSPPEQFKIGSMVSQRKRWAQQVRNHMASESAVIFLELERRKGYKNPGAPGMAGA